MNGLLLLPVRLSVLSCYGHANGTGRAEKTGANNLAFTASFELGDTRTCVDLLIRTGWVPKAVLFARMYVAR